MNVNVKYRAIKLLEDNKGEYLKKLSLGKLLRFSIKSVLTKGKH